jgi:hypothetical protein
MVARHTSWSLRCWSKLRGKQSGRCPELVKTWSLNQHYTIYGQLAVHEGTWVTLHSGDLRHELSEIQRFLAWNNHPNIFVLVYFQVFGEQQVDANGDTVEDVVTSLFTQPIGMTR